MAFPSLKSLWTIVVPKGLTDVEGIDVFEAILFRRALGIAPPISQVDDNDDDLPVRIAEEIVLDTLSFLETTGNQQQIKNAYIHWQSMRNTFPPDALYAFSALLHEFLFSYRKKSGSDSRILSENDSEVRDNIWNNFLSIRSRDSDDQSIPLVSGVFSRTPIANWGDEDPSSVESNGIRAMLTDFPTALSEATTASEAATPVRAGFLLEGEDSTMESGLQQLLFQPEISTAKAAPMKLDWTPIVPVPTKELQSLPQSGLFSAAQFDYYFRSASTFVLEAGKENVSGINRQRMRRRVTFLHTLYHRQAKKYSQPLHTPAHYYLRTTSAVSAVGVQSTVSKIPSASISDVDDDAIARTSPRRSLQDLSLSYTQANLDVRLALRTEERIQLVRQSLRYNLLQLNVLQYVLEATIPRETAATGGMFATAMHANWRDIPSIHRFTEDLNAADKSQLDSWFASAAQEIARFRACFVHLHDYLRRLHTECDQLTRALSVLESMRQIGSAFETTVQHLLDNTMHCKKEEVTRVQCELIHRFAKLPVVEILQNEEMAFTLYQEVETYFQGLIASLREAHSQCEKLVGSLSKQVERPPMQKLFVSNPPRTSSSSQNELMKETIESMQLAVRNGVSAASDYASTSNLPAYHSISQQQDYYRKQSILLPALANLRGWTTHLQCTLQALQADAPVSTSALPTTPHATSVLVLSLQSLRSAIRQRSLLSSQGSVSTWLFKQPPHNLSAQSRTKAATIGTEYPQNLRPMRKRFGFLDDESNAAKNLSAATAIAEYPEDSSGFREPFVRGPIAAASTPFGTRNGARFGGSAIPSRNDVASGSVHGNRSRMPESEPMQAKDAVSLLPSIDAAIGSSDALFQRWMSMLEHVCLKIVSLVSNNETNSIPTLLSAYLACITYASTEEGTIQVDEGVSDVLKPIRDLSHEELAWFESLYSQLRELVPWQFSNASSATDSASSFYRDVQGYVPSASPSDIAATHLSLQLINIHAPALAQASHGLLRCWFQHTWTRTLQQTHCILPSTPPLHPLPPKRGRRGTQSQAVAHSLRSSHSLLDMSCDAPKLGDFFRQLLPYLEATVTDVISFQAQCTDEAGETDTLSLEDLLTWQLAQGTVECMARAMLPWNSVSSDAEKQHRAEAYFSTLLASLHMRGASALAVVSATEAAMHDTLGVAGQSQSSATASSFGRRERSRRVRERRLERAREESKATEEKQVEKQKKRVLFRDLEDQLTQNRKRKEVETETRREEEKQHLVETIQREADGLPAVLTLSGGGGIGDLHSSAGRMDGAALRRELLRVYGAKLQGLEAPASRRESQDVEHDKADNERNALAEQVALQALASLGPAGYRHAQAVARNLNIPWTYIPPESASDAMAGAAMEGTQEREETLLSTMPPPASSPKHDSAPAATQTSTEHMDTASMSQRAKVLDASPHEGPLPVEEKRVMVQAEDFSIATIFDLMPELEGHLSDVFVQRIRLIPIAQDKIAERGDSTEPNETKTRETGHMLEDTGNGGDADDALSLQDLQAAVAGPDSVHKDNVEDSVAPVPMDNRQEICTESIVEGREVEMHLAAGGTLDEVSTSKTVEHDATSEIEQAKFTLRDYHRRNEGDMKEILYGLQTPKEDRFGPEAGGSSTSGYARITGSVATIEDAVYSRAANEAATELALYDTASYPIAHRKGSVQAHEGAAMRDILNQTGSVFVRDRSAAPGLLHAASTEYAANATHALEVMELVDESPLPQANASTNFFINAQATDPENPWSQMLSLSEVDFTLRQLMFGPSTATATDANNTNYATAAHTKVEAPSDLISTAKPSTFVSLPPQPMPNRFPMLQLQQQQRLLSSALQFSFSASFLEDSITSLTELQKEYSILREKLLDRMVFITHLLFGDLLAKVQAYRALYCMSEGVFYGSMLHTFYTLLQSRRRTWRSYYNAGILRFTDEDGNLWYLNDIPSYTRQVSTSSIAPHGKKRFVAGLTLDIQSDNTSLLDPQTVLQSSHSLFAQAVQTYWTESGMGTVQSILEHSKQSLQLHEAQRMDAEDHSQRPLQQSISPEHIEHTQTPTPTTTPSQFHTRIQCAQTPFRCYGVGLYTQHLRKVTKRTASGDASRFGPFLAVLLDPVQPHPLQLSYHIWHYANACAPEPIVATQPPNLRRSMGPQVGASLSSSSSNFGKGNGATLHASPQQILAPTVQQRYETIHSFLLRVRLFSQHLCSLHNSMQSLYRSECKQNSKRERSGHSAPQAFPATLLHTMTCLKHKALAFTRNLEAYLDTASASSYSIWIYGLQSLVGGTRPTATGATPQRANAHADHQDDPNALVHPLEATHISEGRTRHTPPAMCMWTRNLFESLPMQQGPSMQLYHELHKGYVENLYRRIFFPLEYGDLLTFAGLTQNQDISLVVLRILEICRHTFVGTSDSTIVPSRTEVFPIHQLLDFLLLAAGLAVDEFDEFAAYYDKYKEECGKLQKKAKREAESQSETSAYGIYGDDFLESNPSSNIHDSFRQMATTVEERVEMLIQKYREGETLLFVLLQALKLKQIGANTFQSPFAEDLLTRLGL